MISIIKKGLKCLTENGVKYTWNIVRLHYRRYCEVKKLRKVVFSEGEHSDTLSDTIGEGVKISILTPLYNTPTVFLKDLLSSVHRQRFSNWELCLCDASDEQHKEVEAICKEAARADTRIKYKRLLCNGGISTNTNECIAISSGNYFALLDHDDMLHPDALLEVARAIKERGADFVYTDEAKFHNDPQKCFAPNYKPDFAKDDLRSHNYICHLTVYSRQLLERAGYYCSVYDGSQDHDMVLRMTECAERIVHIPRVLYFWRVHKNSVSSDVGVKSYAVEAAHKAVAAQLERTGEAGNVSSIAPYPSLYRIDYMLPTKMPVISVIVYGLHGNTQLRECINAMETTTEYFPMEVLLVEENGNYEELKKEIRSIPTTKPVSIVRTTGMASPCDALNQAVNESTGSYILLLRADTTIISPKWATEMLMFSQRNDMGAVGGKVYKKKSRELISAGIALDGSSATGLHNMFRGEAYLSHGYEAGLCHVRNVTAVGEECLMFAKEKYIKVGGLDSAMGAYAIVDLCLKFRKSGLLNVVTPFVQVLSEHREVRSEKEIRYFLAVWKEVIESGDPYYNPNLKKLKLM